MIRVAVIMALLSLSRAPLKAEETVEYVDFEDAKRTLPSDLPLGPDRNRKHDCLQGRAEALQRQFYEIYGDDTRYAEPLRSETIRPIFIAIRYVEAVQEALREKYGKRVGEKDIPHHLLSSNVSLGNIEAHLAHLDKKIDQALAIEQQALRKGWNDAAKFWLEQQTELVKIRDDFVKLKWQLKNVQNALATCVEHTLRIASKRHISRLSQSATASRCVSKFPFLK